MLYVQKRKALIQILLIFLSILFLGATSQNNNFVTQTFDKLSLPVSDGKHSTEGPGFPHERIAYDAIEAYYLPNGAGTEFYDSNYIGYLDEYCEHRLPPGHDICHLASPDPSGIVLIAGTDEEDVRMEHWTPFNTDVTYLKHFWYVDSGLYDGLYLNDSAVIQALRYWPYVINYYKAGDIASKKLAYYWLGHIVHLLSDVGVPAHVLGDVHVFEYKDAYESFWKLHLQDYSKEGHGWAQEPTLSYSYTSVTENLPINSLPFQPDGCHYSYGSDSTIRQLSDYEKKLFKLFVNLAEKADDYSSNDINCPDSGCKDYRMYRYLQPALGLDISHGLNRYVCPDSASNLDECWDLSREPLGSPYRASYNIDEENLLISMSFTDQWTSYLSSIEIEDWYLYVDDVDGNYHWAYPTTLDIWTNSLETSIGTPELEYMGSQLLPQTANYVAALYNLFWEATHDSMPAVSEVWPLVAVSNVPTDFTVVGTNLPNTLKFSLSDCQGITNVQRGTSSQKFRCTPNSVTSPTVKSGNIKKDSNSRENLWVFHVTYNPPGASPVSSVKPLVATVNESTVFTVTGTNLPHSLAFNIDCCSPGPAIIRFHGPQQKSNFDVPLPPRIILNVILQELESLKIILAEQPIIIFKLPSKCHDKISPIIPISLNEFDLMLLLR